MRRQAGPGGPGAAWDFLTAVVARGEAAPAASWLPWSTAAWHDQPRVWYEVGGDPLVPNARWLLVVVQAPAPAPRDDRPQDLIVVVAPSRRLRHSYSFFALSEELAHLAARLRPADRLLVVGNGGRFQLPLGRPPHRRTAAAMLQPLEGQTPEQLRRSMERAISIAQRWSTSTSAASRNCRLVIVTDLPWWTTSAEEALGWAEAWGKRLRRVQHVALVRPRGKVPSGDGWPLVVGLWRARQYRWHHAEHLRRLLWQAGGWGNDTPLRMQVTVGWFGRPVRWFQLPDAGPPAQTSKASQALETVAPGGLVAAMVRFGLRDPHAGEKPPHLASAKLLGWIQVDWQSGQGPRRTLRRPVGLPEPRSFRHGSPLFRIAWLSVHAGGSSPRAAALGLLPRQTWRELDAPGFPRRWRQLVRLVEKRNAFD